MLPGNSYKNILGRVLNIFYKNLSVFTPLPPPHQGGERQARRGISLPAGIPRHDQFSLRTRDPHIEQAQAFLDAIDLRTGKFSMIGNTKIPGIRCKIRFERQDANRRHTNDEGTSIDLEVKHGIAPFIIDHIANSRHIHRL
jgi:hypothetical protein